MCDQFKRKIKAKKRCCIKTLPNYLIITLKRYEIDVMTMLRKKISDQFEFPSELNLKPWTICGIDENEGEKNKKNNMEKKDRIEEDLKDDYF